MATPTRDLLPETPVEPASIVVVTAAESFIISGSNGTFPKVVISLPSVLTTDSATIPTSLESSDFEVFRPLETSDITKSTEDIYPTLKITIIAATVSLGLTCTISLFIFTAKYWLRRKANKKSNSFTKSARSSLEICCVGIESSALTNSVLPVPPLKTKAALRDTDNLRK